MKQTKITLEENEIPECWYNIVADMPNKPLPPLNPATQEPIGPEALAPLFPMALIEQEVSAERWVEADAVVSSARVGKGARYPRAHLLQVRGRQPGGIA
jgi:predicted alternative tryptophan synthase beta-subunit